jgi:hypothetical protein
VNANLVESLREKDARIAELERKVDAQEQTFTARFEKLEKLLAVDVSSRTSREASYGLAPAAAGAYEPAASAR